MKSHVPNLKCLKSKNATFTRCNSCGGARREFLSDWRTGVFLWPRTFFSLVGTFSSWERCPHIKQTGFKEIVYLLREVKFLFFLTLETGRKSVCILNWRNMVNASSIYLQISISSCIRIMQNYFMYEYLIRGNCRVMTYQFATNTWLLCCENVIPKIAKFSHWVRSSLIVNLCHSTRHNHI